MLAIFFSLDQFTTAVAKTGGRLARVRLPVRTARLELRLPAPSDASALARLVSDPRVARGLLGRPGRYTEAEHRRYVRAGLRAAAKGERLALAVVLSSTRERIGGVGLDLREGGGVGGSLGYWLAPDFWHQGYGSEAVAAVLRIGFRTIGLHRIDANVFDGNPRSAALLRRLGFRIEGHRREVVRDGRRWHGETLFGLLEGEFARTRMGRD